MDFQTCIFWTDRCRHHPLLDLKVDSAPSIPLSLDVRVSRIDDPQCYTKEELSSEEIEHRIHNIIKVGRDEKLELKIPMYENDNCLEVSAILFCYNHLFLLTNLYFSAAFLPSPFRAKPSGLLSPIKGTYR
jgi:hypothetical protein